MSKKKKNADRLPPRNEPQRQSYPESPETTPSLAPTARTYLPESFVVTLLCLTPVAIPAIYYGFQVRQASQEGDQPRAEAASELARTWFIFSVCFGVTANIAMLCVYLISQQT